MEDYSALAMREIMTHATTWMDLEEQQSSRKVRNAKQLQHNKHKPHLIGYTELRSLVTLGFLTPGSSSRIIHK